MNNLEHKINMKLVNIVVPKEQTNVYSIQEFIIQRVQKNCIRLR